ncbi:MAG: hotdog fold thioesterase [Actinobacteria bacterium]|nr:hotdog fold thioesterase [Actinomycetota bacterium]
MLLDDVLGQAVLIRRLPGQWSVTTELNIDVTRPVPADGQLVAVTASPVLIDDAGGLARAEVRDVTGRCLAVATTWARFTPGVPAEVVDPPELADVIERGRCLADLLQVHLGDAGGLRLPPRADLGNPQGVTHGGVLLTLAVMSAEQIFLGRGLDVASVRVTYLRPATGELSFEPEVVHQGRSLGVARVDVRNAAGALCTTATVTLRSPVGAVARPAQG